MTKYLFVYHGGDQPASKEEGEKVTAAWMDWIGQVGKAMVDVGNPTGGNRIVAPNGSVSSGGSDPATGYSIIEAPDMDAALKAAKMCPQLMANGSVEIAEIMPIM